MREVSEFEKRLPILYREGMFYTLEQLKGLSLSVEINKMSEQELLILSEKRLLILFEEKPVEVSILAPLGLPQKLTSENLKKSVETRDILGKSLLETEIVYLKYIYG